MKKAVCYVAALILLMPAMAFGAVSGMDDYNANIPEETQKLLDDTVSTYYQHPSVKKVNTVLDIMNDSKLLRKKSAWPPMIGFLTVIFANNKEHVFDWMSRNDYNEYAQKVFMAALMHAKLKESASVFAQAHQWKKSQVAQVMLMDDHTDLKHLTITVPGHIDTVWGAFFASGDTAYVDEVINVLFEDTLPISPATPKDTKYDLLAENKKLAQLTLREYAPYHEPVRAALRAKIATGKNKATVELLERILKSAVSSEQK